MPKSSLLTVLVLSLLAAPQPARATPAPVSLTGTNWRVQDVSPAEGPAVSIGWINMGDDRIGGANLGVLTLSVIYDDRHVGPLVLQFTQQTRTTPDPRKSSTFGLAFWLDEIIGNGTGSVMTGVSMGLFDGANEDVLREYARVLKTEQDLDRHPEYAHFHTNQRPAPETTPWTLAPGSERAQEIELGEGSLAAGARPAQIKNLRIHEFELLLTADGDPLRLFTFRQTITVPAPSSINAAAIRLMGLIACVALRRV